MSLSELKNIFDDYVGILEANNLKGELTITGGEPFIRDDFLDLLAYISRKKHLLRYCVILTNGSFFTPELLADLQKKAPVVTGMQISIEGDEDINDAIRGKGTFQKILTAAALAKEYGFAIHLAATITKLNYKNIFNLLDLLLIYDLRLVLRRFVPIGQSKKAMEDLMLSPGEMKRFYQDVLKINTEHLHHDADSTFFSANTCTGGIQYGEWRDDQFQTCGVRRKDIIVVMPDGTVYPCRLLPISIGNLTKQSLDEIYEKNYDQFLYPKKQDKACKSCAAYDKCHGGAMCISHAMTGDLYANDPQCWL